MHILADMLYFYINVQRCDVNFVQISDKNEHETDPRACVLNIRTHACNVCVSCLTTVVYTKKNINLIRRYVWLGKGAIVFTIIYKLYVSYLVELLLKVFLAHLIICASSSVVSIDFDRVKLNTKTTVKARHYFMLYVNSF